MSDVGTFGSRDVTCTVYQRGLNAKRPKLVFFLTPRKPLIWI